MSVRVQIPKSRLVDPRQRLLARVVQHAFVIGLQRSEDFLRQFSPRTLMLALSDHPARRARILEQTIGVRPRVAVRKSPESAGEDLQIALDEEETDPDTVLRLFEPDERVEVLDNQRLWEFVLEPRYWDDANPSEDFRRRVDDHALFIIGNALEEGIVSARDVVEAVSIPTIVAAMPREDLVNVLEHVLVRGRAGDRFGDDDLVHALGLEAVVAHLPMLVTWESVIAGKIASASGPTFATLIDRDHSELLFDEREAHPGL